MVNTIMYSKELNNEIVIRKTADKGSNSKPVVWSPQDMLVTHCFWASYLSLFCTIEQESYDQNYLFCITVIQTQQSQTFNIEFKFNNGLGLT